jgi:membrane-bound metal-dependent hydrolase YbcI (DUF457 family)
MDPVSHVICGRAAAALFHREGGRRGEAAAAAILGALAPDVDFVLMPIRWDVYLRLHEVATHSLAGAALLACTAAGLVRLFSSRTRYTVLAAAAAAGAFSHLVLDILSGGRLRLLWPLIGTRVSIPLVAMADPWLLAIFIAGAVALSLRRVRQRQTAALVLAAAAAFLVIKGMLLVNARRAAHAQGLTPQAVEARWGSLTDWYVFERQPHALRTWLVDARGTPAQPLLTVPLAAESPLVTASRSLEVVRNFLTVHELGFVEERPGAPHQTEVRWSDIRFCWQQGAGDPAPSCALWFGGMFDSQGRLLSEQVRIGGRVQTRTPASPVRQPGSIRDDLAPAPSHF